MSGVCHIVCAGPGEVAPLAKRDDGDGAPLLSDFVRAESASDA